VFDQLKSYSFSENVISRLPGFFMFRQQFCCAYCIF